jgi:hypothetical protein
VNGCRRLSLVTTNIMPFRVTPIGFVSLANVCVDSGDLLYVVAVRRECCLGID